MRRTTRPPQNRRRRAPTRKPRRTGRTPATRRRRTEAAEDDKGADEAGEETSSPDDLKVVVSIKGGRAVIGVQRPSADPHIETFDDLDETGLTQEVPAVIDRARARWEDNPRHPAYARPVPVSSRSRRGQGAAQATTADGEEAQQATFGLFQETSRSAPDWGPPMCGPLLRFRPGRR